MVVTLGGVLASPANAGPRAAADPGLARRAAHRPAHRVQVIIQFRDGVSLGAARRIVRRAGGRPGQSLPLIRGLSARMPPRDALRMRWHKRVREITVNRPAKPQEKGGPDPKKLGTTFDLSVNMDKMWDKATGAGVGVAVIDTGIAGDLPDFRSSDGSSASRVIASVVTNPLARTSADTYGHGTHVAGLIAGDSQARGLGDPLFGRYEGVAPDANLIAIKASDDQGNATVLDVIRGLQFAVEHRDDLGIRVINLSLSSASPVSYLSDPLDAAVEAAWMSGIVVVAAAGNRGDAPDAVQYAPANDPYVITVGAYDEQGTKANGDDAIAAWSSRGITQDGLAKPDLYAPGARMISTLAPGSAFASMCPSCIVDGGYIRAGGTSMAAPVVAGAVATMLERHPEWTPDMVKGALLSSLRKGKDTALLLDDVKKAGDAGKDKLVSNQGNRLNAAARSALDGAVDPTRSSWSRSSWSQARGSLSAAWARSSWSCTCSTSSGGAIDPTRSSWSRSSWSNIFDR